jgi:hypothetical protein
MKNKIYGFEYTSCIYESSFETMSLHRTKSGAYKAMRDFLEREYAQWRDDNLKYGKSLFKFGYFERWRIVDMEILE